MIGPVVHENTPLSTDKGDFFNEIRPCGRNKSHLRKMTSLCDMIRLAAGDQDGFRSIMQPHCRQGAHRAPAPFNRPLLIQMCQSGSVFCI